MHPNWYRRIANNAVYNNWAWIIKGFVTTSFLHHLKPTRKHIIMIAVFTRRNVPCLWWEYVQGRGRHANMLWLIFVWEDSFYVSSFLTANSTTSAAFHHLKNDTEDEPPKKKPGTGPFVNYKPPSAYCYVTNEHVPSTQFRQADVSSLLHRESLHWLWFWLWQIL